MASGYSTDNRFECRVLIFLAGERKLFFDHFSEGIPFVKVKTGLDIEYVIRGVDFFAVKQFFNAGNDLIFGFTASSADPSYLDLTIFKYDQGIEV